MLCRIVVLIALIVGGPAAAQDSLQGQIGLGAGFAPDYEGSDEFQPIPIVPISLRYKGYGVQTAGQGVQFDLFGFEFINFGPTFQYRPGRDSGVEDRAVALLPEIDPAFEVGGFFEMNLPFFAPGQDAFTFIGRVSFDVSGSHDGYTIDSALRYSVPIGNDVRLSIVGGTTLASENYNDTYFSVSPAAAAASGLTPFSADGGLKDISATVVATYFVSEHWGLSAIARYKNLLGDAADSPVVEDRGRRHQILGAVALVYRF